MAQLRRKSKQNLTYEREQNGHPVSLSVQTAECALTPPEGVADAASGQRLSDSRIPAASAAEPCASRPAARRPQPPTCTGTGTCERAPSSKRSREKHLLRSVHINLGSVHVNMKLKNMIQVYLLGVTVAYFANSPALGATTSERTTTTETTKRTTTETTTPPTTTTTPAPVRLHHEVKRVTRIV